MRTLPNQLQTQSLNLNNNKDDLGNNQFPPQSNDNEKNKETNLNDPSGSGSK